MHKITWALWVLFPDIQNANGILKKNHWESSNKIYQLLQSLSRANRGFLITDLEEEVRMPFFGIISPFSDFTTP